MIQCEKIPLLVKTTSSIKSLTNFASRNYMSIIIELRYTEWMGWGNTNGSYIAYVHIMKQNYHSIFWIIGVTQTTLLSGFEQISTETRCLIEA